MSLQDYLHEFEIMGIDLNSKATPTPQIGKPFSPELCFGGANIPYPVLFKPISSDAKIIFLFMTITNDEGEYDITFQEACDYLKLSDQRQHEVMIELTEHGLIYPID